MKILADNEFGFGPLMVGFSLLLCALIFYYFAVLRLDYRKTELLDLGPYPDAVEYFAQAKAMLKGGWPSIQIGYDKLPSRYPFGYPVLMLLWLKIPRTQIPSWHRLERIKRLVCFCSWPCLDFIPIWRCCSLVESRFFYWPPSQFFSPSAVRR